MRQTTEFSNVIIQFIYGLLYFFFYILYKYAQEIVELVGGLDGSVASQLKQLVNYNLCCQLGSLYGH